MFKKEKTQEADMPESPKEVEDSAYEDSAYEDSWYRSLKALAEREPTEDDEVVEGPED